MTNTVRYAIACDGVVEVVSFDRRRRRNPITGRCSAIRCEDPVAWAKDVGASYVIRVRKPGQSAQVERRK